MYTAMTEKAGHLGDIHYDINDSLAFILVPEVGCRPAHRAADYCKICWSLGAQLLAGEATSQFGGPIYLQLTITHA
jgi:hypothetical protein